jgi:hypothetical protein
MKWKAQNKLVNKVATNPAKYPGASLHIDASGPLPLPMGRKEYGLKIRDEFSGYYVRKVIKNSNSKKAITMDESIRNTSQNDQM